MTDLFWDEVLLTNNPDSKELEVSFKKIDGDGFLTSQGDEPGTPGGVEEGSDGSQPTPDPEGDFEPVVPPIDSGEDGGGTGTPIDPVYDENNPNPCEPGIDCEGSTSIVVNSGSRAGVFGLYPEAKKISQEINTSLGTIHEIEKGDGELSGWAKTGTAYSNRAPPIAVPTNRR